MTTNTLQQQAIYGFVAESVRRYDITANTLAALQATVCGFWSGNPRLFNANRVSFY